MSALEAAEFGKLGIKVERGTSNITTGLDLFTVSVGNCYVNLFVGEVTTDIENKSVNMTIISTPSTGTYSDIGGVLAIDDDDEGTLYTVEGDGTTILESDGGMIQGHLVPFIVAPGVIEATISATHSGSIKFTLWYVPLEDGAKIVAA